MYIGICVYLLNVNHIIQERVKLDIFISTHAIGILSLVVLAIPIGTFFRHYNFNHFIETRFEMPIK